MKLSIFGGTGHTGRHVIKQALAAGHEVTALARTPSKFGTQLESLQIVEGDIENAAKVAEAIQDAEAVISVLGPTSNTPDHQVSKGTSHILEAMEKYGVQRLVISAGVGVKDPNDVPTPISKIIGILLKLFSRHVYEDMVETVDLVRKSKLDWTIVRVPMLTDEAATGDIKIGFVGKGTGRKISRADMAAFILKQVSDETYLCQAPVISN